MNILVLDDEQARHNLFAVAWGHVNITRAWSAQQAIDALDRERFDVVTLDHDLGDDSKGDGLCVARYIAMMPEDERPSQIFVHSSNPVGVMAMLSTLRRAGIEARQIDPLRLR